MFEIEAEEYVIKKHNIDITKQSVDFSLRCEFAEDFTDFQKGAEFGYNKANEWHYVKYGDLPKDDKQYLVLFFYNYKGKKEMSFGVRDNLHSDFEIHRCYTEQIVAWKEIVLPKESEECTH